MFVLAVKNVIEINGKLKNQNEPAPAEPQATVESEAKAEPQVEKAVEPAPATEEVNNAKPE